ncbi:MAG: type I-E CRISPR-associated protein Cas7/Cse4/CasC [Desulfurivibrio sp.]|nr:type I-E CRISPR-associated protein Cas7/Cse4/CasC [Desulfurivibrio sp.]
MSKPRFLQIHTLHSYTAALLNRDDSGLAKRLAYGGAIRTRISSQCLKRHWRMADTDPHALGTLAGFVESFRSRELVTKKIIDPLREQFPVEVLAELEPEFQKAVYGDKADKGKKNRQTLLLGEPELVWLAAEAERLAGEAENAESAKKLATEWGKSFKDNIKVLRENTLLPGGVSAALFGRMVTSDPAANIDAPVHVGHAFTVHAEESEGDYFTAVDDLRIESEDSGADTIQETELTSGIFYGYVVVDLPGLIRNCGGDRQLAAKIIHNLIYLVAEVSPGAKLGSTAPYGRADLMLAEVGDRQPRSLAAAWRKPVAPDLDEAIAALSHHLGKLDEVYATGEERACFSMCDSVLPGSAPQSLANLAEWAEQKLEAAPDA